VVGRTAVTHADQKMPSHLDRIFLNTFSTFTHTNTCRLSYKHERCNGHTKAQKQYAPGGIRTDELLLRWRLRCHADRANSQLIFFLPSVFVSDFSTFLFFAFYFDHVLLFLDFSVCLNFIYSDRKNM
jgi:hypothetical protein